jgi:hypothetical protein
MYSAIKPIALGSSCCIRVAFKKRNRGGERGWGKGEMGKEAL